MTVKTMASSLEPRRQNS